MENASLIMLIVSLILLAAITFLIFQTWLSIKEIKITFPKMFEELKGYDALIKETIINSKNAHNENITNTANSLNSKINEHSENIKNLLESLENKIINEQNKLKDEIEDSVEKLEENTQKIKEDVAEKIMKLEQNLNNEVD
ncbi:MAG: hypothetical protein P4L45_13125, partial [Ignavibacteriaceae bacterium]|nr:hypothetical protein [Ignavibacteriaceae bacterium]